MKIERITVRERKNKTDDDTSVSIAPGYEI